LRLLRALGRLVCACGMYLSHFSRAVRNAGALTETPLTEIVCPVPSIRIPLLLKSGKFGTPLARMHLENASVELVGLEARLGGEFELFGVLEPQAATVVAAASAAAAVSSRAGRSDRVRWSCIWSPCVLHLAGCDSSTGGDGRARLGTAR